MNERAIIAGALIDAWADRLDSGIPQAQGALRDRNGQCCLGVFADVAGIPHEFERSSLAATYCFVGAFGQTHHNESFPTNSLMREIGLSDTGIPLDGNGWDVPGELLDVAPELLNTDDEDKNLPVMEWSLAHLNDSGKWTFPQIATLLRHNKERLMKIVDGLKFDD